MSTVYEECRVPDWDGFNAIPVSQDTMRQAYIFFESLPLGFPVPTVGADPDGDITFEWYKSPRRTVSISIDMEGDLHYAALIGSSQHHGSMPFVGGIPETIQSIVRLVVI